MISSYPIISRGIRFTFSGLLVTGIHVSIAAVCIKFIVLSPSLANGLAFLTATVFSYIINTLWSFSTPIQRKNLIRFVAVSIIGCACSAAVSGIAEYYHMSFWLGIGGVVCTVPLVTGRIYALGEALVSFLQRSYLPYPEKKIIHKI